MKKNLKNIFFLALALTAAACSTANHHKKNSKPVKPQAAKVTTEPKQQVIIAPGTGVTAPPFPDAPIMPSFRND